MNSFINGLKNATNFTFTENHAITHKTSNSDLLDMFAMGGAYRTRSDEDCILLFKNALEENEEYAMKCLFYLRDVRGGQGERRFFRVCMRWLVSARPETARRNLQYISEYGRWDDLIYICYKTPLWKDCVAIVKHQLALDCEDVIMNNGAVSLLAKWMPSENTSSAKTREVASALRKGLGMTSKQYRKTLSTLRERINVLERLMSAGEWDKIDFSKIPSKAGLKYKNAFAKHDLDRMALGKQTYEDFAKDKNTTVNADTLYPYEVVAEVMKVFGGVYSLRFNAGKVPLNDTNRLMVNKYWDNLYDYFQGASLNAMAVVDVSGSMFGDCASAPLNVAISLGMYCAEKAKGPYAGHFMTFSSKPDFVKVEGVDFYDKVVRMTRTDWGGSTNIEACFDLMLKVAIDNNLSQDEIPASLIIISDMEFDDCATSKRCRLRHVGDTATLMEMIEKRWNQAGYKMPCLTFWNVDARHNNIPMKVKDGVQFVSGMSPSIFQMVMENKNAFDLMYSVLDSERYSAIK